MHDTGIYSITNTLNGRRYVGSASSIKKRWRQHIRTLGTGKHHSRFMQRCFDKHGESAFRFEVLLYCSRDNLLMYEQALIDGLKPEYNSTPTAGSQLGYRHSDETRAKLKAARARNPSSPRKGMAHTEESRKKISESRKGKGGGPMSDDRKVKIGAAHKGKVIPQEMRDRISKALTGLKQSAATIEKRSAKLRGRKMPEGFSESQRLRMIGSKMSDSAREKLSRSKASIPDEVVRDVRRLLGDKISHRKISDATGVTRDTVAGISCGRNYRWVK